MIISPDKANFTKKMKNCCLKKRYIPIYMIGQSSPFWAALDSIAVLYALVSNSVPKLFSMDSVLASMHLVATVPPRVGKFPPPPAGKSPKSRRRRQFFAENCQNAANISIFRLLGDLARQYQVFWAKMPPKNLDQKGH